MNYEIWRFETARFAVVMTAEPEFECIDLSWDETGEVADKIERGLLDVFCAKCAVYLDGREIASDYLGECIYESPDDFRDHFGLAAKSRADGCNYGSYFSDMVATAIGEAREHLAKYEMPKMRESN